MDKEILDLINRIEALERANLMLEERISTLESDISDLDDSEPTEADLLEWEKEQQEDEEESK